METVKIGVIGIGNMGSAHIACIHAGKIQGLQLTCVCDIRPERVDACREAYPGLTGFTDYEELLQSGLADAVLIAVPHRLHAQIAMRALECGLHVLSEKPADVTVSAARRLNEAAERSDRVFGIMFNQRMSPIFQKARELVQSGALGELKRSVWIITNWYRTQAYYDSGSWRATWRGEGGGVLLNQAPHNLDLWQWICGMPVEVTGFCDLAKYHDIEVEDDATLRVRYENGATGLFITTTGEYPGTNRLEISGTRGKLVLENNTLKHWKLELDEREVCARDPSGSPIIPTTYEETVFEGEGPAHAGILQNFTNAILHGEPLLSPGTEGIRELTLSNAAYLSEWCGNCPIALPFEEGKFDELLARRAAESDYVETESAIPQNTEYSHRWQTRW